jgi:cytochrome c biogenesis protein
VASTRSSDRPSDHYDAPAPEPAAENPRLGAVGFARFMWRQLTSMRTALVLLLLLALAAVPGSLVPQRSSDPNGVFQYQARDPELFRILDFFGLFSTFSTPWFAAIYLLLFVSLIGCIIPRTRHHLEALLARPPKTPARLSRLVGFTQATTTLDAEAAVIEARRVLKSQGYRVERYGSSISAERGYLRETGNLVFHTALVGVLAAVGIGGGFGFTGQRLLVEGEPFTNVRADYDSFNAGSWVDPDALEPFRLRLDEFEGRYDFDDRDGTWHPLGFIASMSTRVPGGEWTDATIEVNSPLDIGGTQVYLLGNGYAPIITIRDADGTEVFHQAVPFLAQDSNLTSLGVIKVPDGLGDQIGMRGFFYPDAIATENGGLASFSPLVSDNALLTLLVYRGDLGLADGSGGNVYNLDTADMEELAGREDPLVLKPGATVDLPDGMGTIEFEGIARYVGLDIHHDPTQGWVLGFALAAVAGLLTSLFIPRRRMWIKVLPREGGADLEYAGLARGEDPALAGAVADLARAHAEALAAAKLG